MSITVGELIAQLSEFDKDTPVVVRDLKLSRGDNYPLQFERGLGGYRHVAPPRVEVSCDGTGIPRPKRRRDGSGALDLSTVTPRAEYPRVTVVSLG